MDDLISRQEVIEKINCWIDNGEYRCTNATYYLTKRNETNTGYGVTIIDKEESENLND